jgi:hypothetical protein
MQTFSCTTRAAGLLAVVIGLHLSSGSASADPVRVTVQFEASGDVLDPDFGGDVAAGLFSVVVNRPKGGGFVGNGEARLGADRLRFDFANTSWTPANADVIRLLFDRTGTLLSWQFAGDPSGLGSLAADVYPDILAEAFNFSYSTFRSPQLGVFANGRMLGWATTTTPVPEPGTLLLFASGVAAAGARKSKSRRTLLREGPAT